MDKHESAIRELSRTALGASTFRGFVSRWEINKEPPPTPESEKRPASHMSSFTSSFPRLFAASPQNASLRESDAEDSYFNSEDDDDPVVPVPRATDSLLGLFRRKRQRISAPGPHTLLNKGALGRQREKGGASPPQQQQQQAQKGRQQPPPLCPVSPLSSLLEYDDEEDVALTLADDLAGAGDDDTPSSAAAAAQQQQHRQIEILPYEGSSSPSDPEDDLLESLVSKAGDGEAPAGLDLGSDEEMAVGGGFGLKPQGKKRRAAEEEEEDALERLAPKNRRLSFSVSDVAEQAASRRRRRQLKPFSSVDAEEGDEDAEATPDLDIGFDLFGSGDTKSRTAEGKGGKAAESESESTVDTGKSAGSTATTVGGGAKKLRLKLSGSKSLLGAGTGTAKTNVAPLGGESKDGGNG